MAYETPTYEYSPSDDAAEMMEVEYDEPTAHDLMDGNHRRAHVYPSRLMVDFTSLNVKALKRYAQYYHLNAGEEAEKSELAAMVARHFDGSLHVDEEESIVSFIQRIRNGEKSTTKRSNGSEKDRRQDKKCKKSSSRKRQRDDSVASTHSASSGRDVNHGSSDDKRSHSTGSTSSSRSSRGTSSGGSHSGGHGSSQSSSKKQAAKNDVQEDDELYCICNLPSYGNMIACDGKKCPNPSQWYHWECVGLSDGPNPDTWLCPECDPKSFQAFLNKKKKSKARSKSPGSK